MNCEKCGKPLDEHPMIDVSNVKVLQMCDRHPKWQRVEPGTVIPAGQPYRAEFVQDCSTSAVRITETASESVRDRAMTVPSDSQMSWFVDSSWRPPLELPTTPTWGIAVYKNSGCYVAQQADRWVVVGGQLVGNAGNTTRVPMSAQILDFIPLTDEQVARIEAAR